MFQLFETISVVDYNPENLCDHQSRMDESFIKFYGCENPFNLSEKFQEIDVPSAQRYKWRLEYELLSYKSTIEPYIAKDVLKLGFVEIPESFDYSLKFKNRELFIRIQKLNPQFDEIILLKNGFFTDSLIANIVVKFSHDPHFYTPSNPLLNGTHRQRLIKNGILYEKNIHKEEFTNIEKLFFINAMLPFEQSKSWEPKF